MKFLFLIKVLISKLAHDVVLLDLVKILKVVLLAFWYSGVFCMEFFIKLIKHAEILLIAVFHL